MAVENNGPRAQATMEAARARAGPGRPTVPLPFACRFVRPSIHSTLNLLAARLVPMLFSEMTMRLNPRGL
jgi:hypothetical protein